MGKHAKNELMYPTDGRSLKACWRIPIEPKHNKQVAILQKQINEL